MQLIVTHPNADFDAVASQFAASKLWPDATVVRSKRLGRPVHQFFALHKDLFRTREFTDIDPDAVDDVILVDARGRSRLIEHEVLWARRAATPESVRLRIIDHHPASDDDLVGDHEWIEPTGAAVTLLLEQMQCRGIEPTPKEATLFLLGIYADTGSLLFPSTTARDARSAAWLIECGAELPVVGRYLHRAWSTDQRALLIDILSQIETFEVAGLDIGLVAIEPKGTIDGMAEVVGQALAIDGYAALFAAIRLKGSKVQLVARSRSAAVEVGAVARALGGGGHPAAAAAMLRDTTTDAVILAVKRALCADPPHPRQVKDLMTSPVQTVAPDLPLRDLETLLCHAPFKGMPVVREGEVVGMISRRDIEKARRDERMALTVASCMAHHLITATPDDAIEAALAKMTDHDVGRLPVLRGGKLVGILSRTDALRALYGDPPNP
mgnify:CR=1 FL=1